MKFDINDKELMAKLFLSSYQENYRKSKLVKNNKYNLELRKEVEFDMLYNWILARLYDKHVERDYEIPLLNKIILKVKFHQHDFVTISDISSVYLPIYLDKKDFFTLLQDMIKFFNGLNGFSAIMKPISKKSKNCYNFIISFNPLGEV